MRPVFPFVELPYNQSPQVLVEHHLQEALHVTGLHPELTGSLINHNHFEKVRV